MSDHHFVYSHRGLRQLIVAATLIVAPMLMVGALHAAPSDDAPLAVAPSHPGGDVVSPITARTSAERLATLHARLAGLQQEIDAARRPSADGGPADGVAAGPQPGPVENVNTGVTYNSLEAAVLDASSGDRLRVSTGPLSPLSEGRFTIDKNLTIEGATGSETIQASEDTGSSGDDRAWILVDAGVELEVRNLRFDGNGQQIWQAFRHQGSGRFFNVEFEDIQFQSSGPSYQGVAIVAFGDDVDVIDCSFEDIGRVGVLYFGTGISNSLAFENRYQGKGDGDFLDYGFELSGGANALIIGNRISDNRGVASSDGSGSAAILVSTFFGAGTSMLARSNDITDNTIGMAVGFDASDTSEVDAGYDRLVGNAFGITSSSELSSVNATNTWWGCNEGPDTVDCDNTGGAGSATIHTEPWLELRYVASDAMPCIGELISVAASLRFNSFGAYTGDAYFVPDDFPATFDPGVLGTVAPLFSTFMDGRAGSFYTAGQVPGSETLSVTVDNESASLVVTLIDAIFCDGFEGGSTSQWSATIQ